MSQCLSRAEEETLEDINRLIDFYQGQSKAIDVIVVTPRQYNAMQHIAKKAEDRAVFDRIGKVDITQTHYRKIRFDVKKPLRKKCRANSTADFLEDRA